MTRFLLITLLAAFVHSMASAAIATVVNEQITDSVGEEKPHTPSRP